MSINYNKGNLLKIIPNICKSEKLLRLEIIVLKRDEKF